MPGQEQEERQDDVNDDAPPPVNAPSGAIPEAEKLKDELDELLDEIDEVLEVNAEDFVKSYIQKGGQ